MNTAAPFYGRTGEWTDAELAADIALCRKVLRDGEHNGYPLNSESEAEWRDWLHDFEIDAEMREEARHELYAPTIQQKAA